MDVLQGRYCQKISGKNGKLKGLKIKTEAGTLQVVRLPKPLRVIAQQELALGDSLRVWTTYDKALSKGQKSRKGKERRKRADTDLPWALQLVPLSPQQTLLLAEEGQETDEVSTQKVNPKKDQKSKTKAKSSKKVKRAKSKAKSMTVQLCQKKNCCKRGGTQLWKSFEAANQQRSDASTATFKLEAVGCLGGCKRGPNLRFLPDNVKHYKVQPGDIDGLLQRHQG